VFQMLQVIVSVVSDQYITDTHGSGVDSMVCCSVLRCVADRLQCVAVYTHRSEQT